MSETNFPLELKLRIDWSELDLFGHVNNVMFMKYAQAARVNYWENSGIYSELKKNKVGPMLVSVACQFKKQLLYPGNVTVRSGMEFIRNTSFSIHHKMYDDQGDLVAEAQDVIVMFDFNKNEKTAVPQVMREAAEKLESRKLS
ncbi:MAG: acyl-CoA thioesterase [Bacteroidia bacterium]